jgi:Ca-activated chloride channel family protein
MRPVRLFLLAFVLIAAAPPAGAMMPDDVMGGRIVGVEGGRAILFPVLKTGLEADIRGDLATVTVTQTFANPGTVPLDATYLFPLPEKAAVHGMVMAVGDGRIEPVIEERAEATASFEAAGREGRNASLRAQPNLFARALANLMPGEPITVTLRYEQSVPRIDGTYELVVPLVVGRVPEHAAVAALTLPQVIDPERVSIRVRLAAGLAIASAGSRTHVLARTDDSRGLAIFTLSRGEIIDNRDFVFRYRLAGDRTPPASRAWAGARARPRAGRRAGGLAAAAAEAAHPRSLPLRPPKERVRSPGIVRTLYFRRLSR